MFAEGKSFIHFILYIYFYMCVHSHLHLAPTFLFFLFLFLLSTHSHPLLSSLRCASAYVLLGLSTPLSPSFLPFLLSIPAHSPVHYRAESSDLQGPAAARRVLHHSVQRGEREGTRGGKKNWQISYKQQF